jgi:hypothetical protein
VLSRSSLVALVAIPLLIGCDGDEPFPADAGMDADADAGADAATDADAEPDTSFPPGPWRSALYPEGWTPDAGDPGGPFLHDFSYAGYHGGEGALGAGGPTDVVVVAADTTGAIDATGAIQSAIDMAEGAAEGGVVHLPAGTYRVDGTLVVDGSSVVIRGDGPDATRLHFTNLLGMGSRSHLTFVGAPSADLEVPLAMDAANRSAVVVVEDASGLAVGDDVDLGWVITPEFVAEHEMTPYWEVFNDEWQPFFRREIVAIDESEITLDVPLRYPVKVRDGASLRRTNGWLREVGVESLGVANAGDPDEAWGVSQTHAIEMAGVADGWVHDVASFSSPSAPTEGEGAGAHLASGGIIIRASKRVTVADTHFAEAQNRGPGGNGYLFEVRTSSEILFRDVSGRAGRHAFISNWGFGTTGVVWLRAHSSEGRSLSARDGISTVGLSDFHHSLAMANLVDSSVLDDGWSAFNRLGASSGAGHGATQTVFWNNAGGGRLRSFQWGLGYVIGTAPTLEVSTWGAVFDQESTEPEDFREGIGREGLVPASLYEDQLARRLSR